MVNSLQTLNIQSLPYIQQQQSSVQSTSMQTPSSVDSTESAIQYEIDVTTTGGEVNNEYQGTLVDLRT